jgi:hypothetical protein
MRAFDRPLARRYHSGMRTSASSNNPVSAAGSSSRNGCQLDAVDAKSPLASATKAKAPVTTGMAVIARGRKSMAGLKHFVPSQDLIGLYSRGYVAALTSINDGMGSAAQATARYGASAGPVPRTHPNSAGNLFKVLIPR